MWTILLTGWMALARAAGGGGPCEGVDAVRAFQSAAQEGEAAFAQLDLARLRRAADEALQALSCLREPIDASQAAAFHRLMALLAFTEQDQPRVLREFHAARRLQPGYAIPEEVAPPGHPLVRLYEQALQADEGELVPLAPPRRGYVLVDGVRGAPWPSGISAIVQVFDASGELVETVLLQPGMEPPAWGPPPATTPEARRRRFLLGAGAGTSAFLSGLFYAGAWLTYAQFERTEFETVEEAESLKSVNNALFYSSLGFGVAAAGLGVTAVITW